MGHSKGDVRTAKDVRAECKTTSAASYSLKLHDWKKIQSEAINGLLEVPVMQVEFQGPLGMNTKLAVISWDHFLQMRELERQAEEP
jgi:hypothetical protein